MPLLYAPDGTLWPAGSLVRTISTDADLAFEAGTLPSWLTVEAGTAAVSTNDVGGVQVTSTATTNATAGLQGPQIDLADVRRVRLDVVFTGGVTSSGRRFEVGFQGASSGGWFRQNASGDYGALAGRAAGPTDTYESVMYQVNDTGVSKRFLVSLIVDPADGLVAIGEGDSIFAMYDFGAGLAAGTVRPFVRWTNTASSAVTGHVHQVVLRREWL
jgi:hypothetical protein